MHNQGLEIILIAAVAAVHGLTGGQWPRPASPPPVTDYRVQDMSLTGRPVADREQPRAATESITTPGRMLLF
jgi:hypothetical protein